MRLRASVFALAAVLAAGAYALVSRSEPERGKQEEPPPSPLVKAVALPRADTALGSDVGADPERTLRKAAGRVVRGSVLVAKTLEPLEGARVALLGPDPRAPALAEVTTRTDGSYALDLGGPARPSAVEVRKAGFLPARSKIYGEPDESHDFELESGRDLKGRVVLPDGLPVTSGRIFVLENYEVRSSGIHFPIARDGTFEAVAEGDEVAVLAVGDGFQPGASGVIDLRFGLEAEIVIDVEPGRTVWGVVQDGNGLPIPGATIEGPFSCKELDAFRLDRPSEAYPEAVTDAGGRFSLGGFSGEPVEIDVKAEGFLGKEEKEEGGTFRITLEPVPTHPTRRMTFGVSGIASGDPLPALAYLGTNGDHRVMKLEGTRYSRANFETEGDKGWLQVPGYERVPVEWPEGDEDHDFGEISLRRGRTFEISIIDGKGRGVPGASVLLEPNFSDCGNYDGLGDVAFETDSNGHLLLGGLWKDTHGLWITKAGFIGKHLSFDTEAGKTTIILGEEASLRGRVLGTDGRPVSRAKVVFELDDRNRAGDITDWTGAFMIRLPAGRDLRGILTARNAAPTPVQVATLAPGERRDLGDLGPDPGETLRGRAIGEDGRPLALRAISIDRFTDDDDDDALARFLPDDMETRTDRDGGFEFRGLLPGRYTVEMSFEENSDQVRRVSLPFPGTFLFALDDPELQMYSGVVRDADGSPLRGAFVSLRTRESRDEHFSADARTDAEGKFKFRGVPQDLFLPVVSVRHGFLSTSIRVDAVPDLPGEIVIERGSTIQIRVELEGKPDAFKSRCYLCLLDGEGSELGTLGIGRDAVIRSERVPPGAFRGTILAPGYFPVTIDIETRNEQVFTATVALRKLPLTRICSFLVKDADGNPLEDAFIRSSVNLDRLPDRCWTGEDGTGTIHMLAGNESSVTVQKGGYYPVRLQPADFGGKKAVEVVLRPNGAIDARVSIPGDARDLDYSLRVEPLEVPRWDASKWSGGCTIEGPDDCTFNDLPAGRYALLVMSASGSKPWILAREEVTVIDGANTAVPLELPAHFQVRGVVTSAGKPLARNPIVLSTSKDGREYRLRSNLDDAGRFSRSACVPGTYTVSVGVGGALRRVATAEITGEIDLALELEP